MNTTYIGESEPTTVKVFRDICTRAKSELRIIASESGNQRRVSRGEVINPVMSQSMIYALLPYTTFLEGKGIAFLSFERSRRYLIELKIAWSEFLREISQDLPRELYLELCSAWDTAHETLTAVLQKENPANKLDVYQKLFDLLKCASEKFNGECIVTTGAVIKEASKEAFKEVCDEGNSETGYEFVVKQIRRVYDRMDSNSRSYPKAAKFVRTCKDKNDSLYDDFIKARAICEDLAKNKSKKKANNLDAIWNTSQKYASNKNWPDQKKRPKRRGGPTITPIPQGWQ